MEKETLKNIFKFLEQKGGYKTPIKWKLENNITLSKGLKVGGDLNIRAAELMRYSNEKLMKMIDPNGDGEGYITGRIIR